VRQVLALAATATLMIALADACGGGSADTEEVGARKAACKSAPDFSLGSPSRTPDVLVPMSTATRSGSSNRPTPVSLAKPASHIASRAVATANCELRDMRRASLKSI